jgi:hypothetical protein
MRPTFAAALALAVTTLAAVGQGTLVYDQQSATNRSFNGYGAPFGVEQPFGQAFTPALSSVGFVQLELDDPYPGDGIGATVYVNLWADSLATGTLVDSTAPVAMPDRFFLGITNFVFARPVPVTAGTTYYLQPVVQSGDNSWAIIAGDFAYPSGTLFINGHPDVNGFKLWFREGTYVPEPSSTWLFALAASTFCAARFRCLTRLRVT